jgi:hypothetical protein
MLEILLAGLILGGATMLQSTVIVQTRFLYGAADLVLLTLLGWTLHKNAVSRYRWGTIAGLLVGLVSDAPWWLMVAGYVGTVAFADLLVRRVWEIELLTLFTTTFVGSILTGGLVLVYRLVSGVPMPLLQSFNLVLLPSTLINLFLILPVYAVLGEFAKSVYPVEVDE